jgi:hypothetical protein
MTWERRNQELNMTHTLTCQPVVGRDAYIISDTGRIADVNPFTPDCKGPVSSWQKQLSPQGESRRVLYSSLSLATINQPGRQLVKMERSSLLTLL